MISVRESTFETNSSSVHSLTLASEKEYKEWEEGKALFGHSSERFFKVADLYETCIEAEKKDLEYRKKSLEERPNDDWAKKSYNAVQYVLDHLPSKENFDKYVKENLGSDGLDIGNFDNNLWDDATLSPEKVTEEEIIMYMLEEVEDYKLETESSYYDNDYYETYCHDREIDGVKVYAFGYYGHD